MSKQNHNIPKDYKEAEAKGEQPLAGAVVGDGKAAKDASKPKTQPMVGANGAVVSNMDGGTFSKRSRIIIFAVLAVLVLASAGWLIFNRSKTADDSKTGGVSEVQKEAVEAIRSSSGDAGYSEGSSIDTSKIKNVETAVKVAAQLQQLGDTKNATAVLIAVKPSETDYQALYSYNYALGVMARVDGKNQEAISYFEKALDAIKQTPDAKVNINYVGRQVDELTVVIADLKAGGQ